MGLFKKDPTEPTPYPTEDQAPYTDGQDPATQQRSYPQSDPAYPGTDSSMSQGGSNRKNGIMGYRPRLRGLTPKGEEQPKVFTRYMGMLLHQSQVIEKKPYWNILAAALTWILLAGYIVLPGTYTKFQKSEIIEAAKQDQSNLGNKILASIANIGLLVVAGILCGVGLLGIVGLWFRWGSNYIWFINKVLLPALLNSVMGLLSTLVNVLSKPEISFNPTAIATTSVTGGLSVLFTLMFLYYNNFLLEELKAEHRASSYGDQDPKDAIDEHRAAYGDQDLKDAIADQEGQRGV